MVNLEENMKNLKDLENRVTVGEIINLTGTRHGDWYDFKRHDGKLHHATLTNMAIIPGLHKNIFSITRALQKDPKGCQKTRS